MFQMENAKVKFLYINYLMVKKTKKIDIINKLVGSRCWSNRKIRRKKKGRTQFQVKLGVEILVIRHERLIKIREVIDDFF